MEREPHIHMGGDKVVFSGPIGWRVIFGLIFATFLTLVVVPTMYLLLLWLMCRAMPVADLRTPQVEVPAAGGNGAVRVVELGS